MTTVYTIHWFTVFAWLSTRSKKSASPLFFAEVGGPASAKGRLLMLNLPPEVTKNIPFLLSCLQTSAEFRHFSNPFALSLFIFAAWSYYWPINDLFTCGLLRQTSKLTEQQERKGAITANTLRSEIIEVCGKTEDRQHPYFRIISQPLPAPCA